jgi:hypothetical protein
MKYNSRTNKTAQYIGIVLLILVLAFTTIGATVQTNIEQKSVAQIAISNYLAAQQNSDLSDEEKIKAAIDAYFATRYEGQKLVETQDFSTLVEDDTSDWVKKEKDKREIELYIASLFDLGYQSYSYTLDYDSIEIKNNKAIVQVRESHDVVFNATAPEVSKLANLQHVITLHNKKDVWVIYKDEYQDELSQQLDNTTKEKIKEQVDQNHQDDQKRKDASSSAPKVLADLAVSPLSITYSYNRSRAVSYADTYWNGTGPYYRRDPEGKDCTNFVSQAIYSGQGKTPPDTSGMATGSGRNWNYDWYYTFGQGTGPISNSGSDAWVNVTAQRNFITGNTARIGPYGSQITNLCYIKTGDVVQLNNGTWFHEGIIVSVYYPPSPSCPGLGNILVDAHTIDRYHYPVSYWSSYGFRWINILGWRK